MESQTSTLYIVLTSTQTQLLLITYSMSFSTAATGPSVTNLTNEYFFSWRINELKQNIEQRVKFRASAHIYMGKKNKLSVEKKSRAKKHTRSSKSNFEGGHSFMTWNTAFGCNFYENIKKEGEKSRQNLHPRPWICERATTAAVWMWWFIRGRRSDVGKCSKTPGRRLPTAAQLRQAKVVEQQWFHCRSDPGWRLHLLLGKQVLLQRLSSPTGAGMGRLWPRGLLSVLIRHAKLEILVVTKS